MNYTFQQVVRRMIFSNTLTPSFQIIKILCTIDNDVTPLHENLSIVQEFNRYFAFIYTIDNKILLAFPSVIKDVNLGGKKNAFSNKLTPSFQIIKILCTIDNDVTPLHENLSIVQEFSRYFAFIYTIDNKILLAFPSVIKDVNLGGKKNAFSNTLTPSFQIIKILCTIDNDVTPLHENLSIVQEFNRYFAFIYTIDNKILLAFPSVTKDVNLSIIYFDVISVSYTIKFLKNSISSGPDKIPNFDLKNTIASIIYPLSLLFEKSFITNFIHEI